MQITSTYSVAIRSYNRILKQTVVIYRTAIDFFIQAALAEWQMFCDLEHTHQSVRIMESLTHATGSHPQPKYDFDSRFYKFPSYLRRAAINKAVGLVSSYKSNHANWEASGHKGSEPSMPTAGNSFPVMYKGNMFADDGDYSAHIKIYDGAEWAWFPITFCKSDVDYITRHCGGRERLSPSLVRRGKKWYLDFPFRQNVRLHNAPAESRYILAVDLGLNNACTCVVMTSDGAVHGRKFLKLPVETDRLETALNRVKKAQQHGQYKTPRLWAVADGINDDIAVKTAAFITDMAVLYNVDVIVFEHLDINNKKRGGRSKRQRLHLWRARYVQSMVTGKAHRLGIRISHVCSWSTSRLAFDGSGRATRGTYIQNGAERYNYSVCTFTTGKQYNCDLNAAYNIGARYFVRELLKSVPETSRLALEAKVPSAAKRSTSTLSTLLSLNAELKSMAA